ncbi:hypothetical protein D9Q98_000488 [Chlorella vulgaris]|uniref:Glycosyl hydrolase family 32 N-terminal domain-containing protein n=1 Tax=Chlorella vulgaris TaxID=3077 RepID=A0A9D4TYH1_CHLVU|nr:hypothetical protein D9Q98_000488 [Chlorella vulgaris]
MNTLLLSTLPTACAGAVAARPRSVHARRLVAGSAAPGLSDFSRRRSQAPCAQAVRRRSIAASATTPSPSSNGAQVEGLKYDHILLAILDSNPVLSTASRTALVTAAAIATQNSSKLTVMFVDEEGQTVSGQRLQLVQGELLSRGVEATFVEEQVEAASVGKGSAAVGEVADSVEADLVVLSTAAVHDKHVDANLLAEFVPCPVLLLPQLISAGRGLRRPQACQSSSNGASAVATQPGLLLPCGEGGAWDEAGVGHAVVRYFLGDDEQRWFMWYTGRSTACPDLDGVFPSSGSIGLAVSSDGINWQRGSGMVEGARGPQRAQDVGKVLAPNGDWWWFDTCHMNVADVQILSSSSVSSGTGVYWMFYSGGSYEQVALPAGMAQASQAAEGGDLEGLRLRPGLAMSQDGRNWARIESEHHTGALFDVGQEGEWDELFIGGPQVVAAGPRDMRMFYHSYSRTTQRYVVGLATSPDGFKWTKAGPVFEGGSSPDDFDARGAASRCVVRDIDSKQYFMFYEAVAADGRRSIGVAVSKDGLRGWQRCPKPVLEGSGKAGAWDEGGVGCPWAVSMAGGAWRLYYSGRAAAGGGAWSGIGLARSVEGGSVFQGAPSQFERH